MGLKVETVNNFSAFHGHNCKKELTFLMDRQKYFIYIQMRDLVNKKSFLFRKKLDNLLHWMFPKW